MWLGIDFGTCWSSAAFIKDGMPTPVKFDANITSLPSSAYIDVEGRVLVGKQAENRRGQETRKRYVREFKRDLGRTVPYQLGDRELLPEQLVAELLRRLKDEADKQSPNGKAFTSALITVPATYKKPKREVMLRAGEAAGFADVELLEEPVAAAIYHASRKGASRTGEITLVYDLGGGTFDAALIRKEEDGYHLLAVPVGNDRLGGADFDDKIFSHLLGRCSDHLRAMLTSEGGAGESEEAQSRRARTKLFVKDALRDLKHLLSEEVEATKDFPQTMEDFTLKREAFNEMIAPMIAETCELCQQLVRSAGLELEAVDRVLLVGGSCRIPFVREAVESGLGRPVVRVDDPELAVCLGAAVHSEAVQKVREEEERRPLREQYRRAVRMAWADAKLEEKEFELLEELKADLGLAAEEAAEVEREVMGDSKEAIIRPSRPDAEITERQLLASVSLSSKQIKELGGLLVEAMNAVGRDGVIKVEESETKESTLEIVEGLRIDCGYLTPQFVTDLKREEVLLENVRILIRQDQISLEVEILPFLEECNPFGNSLLVVAGSVSGKALDGLIDHASYVNEFEPEATLKVAAVEVPAHWADRKSVLEDIAIYTGGEVISGSDDLNKFNPEELFGSAQRVVITAGHTTIIGGGGRQKDIQSRVKKLKAEIDAAPAGSERERLRERLANLVGGVAVIKVGGTTEELRKEKKAGLEAAIQAARSAIENGRVKNDNDLSEVCVAALTGAGSDITGLRRADRQKSQSKRAPKEDQSRADEALLIQQLNAKGDAGRTLNLTRIIGKKFTSREVKDVFKLMQEQVRIEDENTVQVGPLWFGLWDEKVDDITLTHGDVDLPSKKFRFILPKGLEFTDTEKEIVRKLGKPDSVDTDEDEEQKALFYSRLGFAVWFQKLDRGWSKQISWMQFFERF